ncbi:MAG: alpha/beta fold hydrolase [Myxococcaceae bacterium]|nr:alpha/beta fold hydrolase [Myxococcaceae bacterium]
MHPVLFIHGLNDRADGFAKMQRTLETAGAMHLHAVDLVPNDGSVSLRELAAQVDRAAETLLRESGAEKLDIVAFSMGTLVARHWLQKLNGKARTRRFISISGPHAGTWAAHLLRRPGIREMRPGSAFLRELEADPDPFGDVEVHVLYTPLDLIILPAKSSLLKQARSARAFPVLLHPLMLSDRRVLRAVRELLEAP